MKKYLVLFTFGLLVLSPMVMSQDEAPASRNVTTTYNADEDERFNPRTSHWVSTVGFETMDIELPFEYNSSRPKFTNKVKRAQNRSLYGGRLGVGREFYLGWGFSTATKVSGYYMGTLFTDAETADPEFDSVEVNSFKRSGHVWGLDASQSLSWFHEFKTKNPFLGEMVYLAWEPFVEAGIGKAWAYNRLNYQFDTGPTGTREYYDHNVRDDILTAKVGGGINFIAMATGAFLYVRADIYSMDITQRRQQIKYAPNQGATTTNHLYSEDVDTDPITVYAVGGGYKF